MNPNPIVGKSMLDNDLLPDVSYTTWEVYEEALRYFESKGYDDGSS